MAEVKTFSSRLQDLFYEASDLLEDLEAFHEESDDNQARPALHKMQEVMGPLSSALSAAQQNGV